MEKLQKILLTLKDLGCCGIKISFEDEGALYNEMVSMTSLISLCNLDLSIKIGGCEAKRDIVDCLSLNCSHVVAPMVESKFSLSKFISMTNEYNFNKKKGINVETIQSYNNLDDMSLLFDKVDFITFGRVDFVKSLDKDRSFVDSEEMYQNVKNVFEKAREYNLSCYLGGAITINSKDFIEKLMNNNLLDKFETRYIMFDVNKININDFNRLLHYANIFEVEWLKYIHNRYNTFANKDIKRIEMISERLSKNTFH